MKAYVHNAVSRILQQKSLFFRCWVEEVAIHFGRIILPSFQPRGIKGRQVSFRYTDIPGIETVWVNTTALERSRFAADAARGHSETG